MPVATTVLKVQKVIIKNAPTILAVAGAIGAIASTGLAIKGTLKCQTYLNEYAREQDGPIHRDCVEARYLVEKGVDAQEICNKLGKTEYAKDADDAKNYISDLVAIKPMSTGDKIWMYIRSYGPALTALGLSIACIFGCNHLNKLRILELAGAYALSRKELKEYKDKVKSMLGDGKFTDFSDAITQEKILANPPTEENTIKTNIPNPVQLSLWYDETSNRYFYSNAEYIRKAEIQATAMLQKNGFVGLNDVYSLLGIEEIPLGENLGWDKEVVHEVNIIIGTALLGPDVPCGTIRMEVHPTSAWLSEV